MENNEKLNEAIRTIKEVCGAPIDCPDCPMSNNCDNIKHTGGLNSLWEEVGKPLLTKTEKWYILNEINNTSGIVRAIRGKTKLRIEIEGADYFGIAWMNLSDRYSFSGLELNKPYTKEQLDLDSELY